MNALLGWPLNAQESGGPLTKLGTSAQTPKTDTEEEINGQRRGQLQVAKKIPPGNNACGQSRRTATFQNKKEYPS